LNSVNNTSLEASIYRLRIPKTSLSLISLGGVRTEALNLWTVFCAIGFA
jgi:hypothetical protein